MPSPCQNDWRWGLCYAAAILLQSPAAVAAGAQQKDAVSSELLCDWWQQKKTPAATAPATTEAVADPQIRLGQVQLEPKPIFKPDPDALWLHRLANWAHVTTRPDTVLRALPFASGAVIRLSDLAEAERLLRDKSYLHDAKVRLSPVCNADQSYDVHVETSDNWSLLPSFGLGRSGGQNKYAFGFKEDNLLGFGVRTSVKYQSDAQRSGYELKLEMPLSLLTAPGSNDWLAHSDVTAEWTRNDDGQVRQFKVEKPFYQDDSQWMYRTEWFSEQQQSQLFHNGALENVFATDHRRFDFSAGLLWSYQHQTSTRLLAGVLVENWRFAPALRQPSLALPADRDWAYPWLGVEYKQHDYRVLRDILFIDRAEDVNLGWQYLLKMAAQSSKLSAERNLGYRVSAASSKGFAEDQHLLLLQGAVEWMLGLPGGDLREWRFKLEDFYQLSANFTWYNKAEYSRRNRNFIDQPLELGGDSGLRGYPLQYQHGIRKSVLTTELRWYPRINLYQMLDLGFVAFSDIGRVTAGRVAESGELNLQALASSALLPANTGLAWSGVLPATSQLTATSQLSRSDSDMLRPNVTEQWLGSVGVGMRIYSAKSSNDHVIHIDLSFPLRSSPAVDSWEIELSVSNRF
jgi:hypothetical protein